MKKIILTVVALICFSLANAQNGVKYQGEASFGFGAGTGTFNMNRINIHTIHGVRLCENFFVGAGLGVDCFFKDGNSGTIIPIFANAKGYLPISSNLSLLAAIDLGYGVGTGNFGSFGGFYTYPQIGCSLKVARSNALDFTVGYHHQSLSERGLGINMGAIAFKVAFLW